MQQGLMLMEQSDMTNEQKFDYDDQMTVQYCQRPSQFEISPNQQLLAIQYSIGNIAIFYLKKKSKIKTLTLSLQNLDQFKIYNRITVIKFSVDSKYLLCGINFGFLYVFRADKSFKLVSSQYLHQSSIKDIIFINNAIITCTTNGSIIVSDFMNKTSQLKIPYAHISNIQQIEFDSINQFIISCSADYSIKFFHFQNGELFIHANNVDDSDNFKIFLINNNKQIISSSTFVKLWQIDHQNQQLILMRYFEFKQHYIYRFQLLNKNGFIFISREFIFLLDNDLEVLSQQSHTINNICCKLHFLQQMQTPIESIQPNTQQYLAL